MADSKSRNTADYTNRLIKSVVHVVELASRSLQSAELSWGQGFAQVSSKRCQPDTPEAQIH